MDLEEKEKEILIMTRDKTARRKQAVNLVFGLRIFRAFSKVWLRWITVEIFAFVFVLFLSVFVLSTDVFWGTKCCLSPPDVAYIKVARRVAWRYCQKSFTTFSRDIVPLSFIYFFSLTCRVWPESLLPWKKKALNQRRQSQRRIARQALGVRTLMALRAACFVFLFWRLSFSAAPDYILRATRRVVCCPKRVPGVVWNVRRRLYRLLTSLLSANLYFHNGWAMAMQCEVTFCNSVGDLNVSRMTCVF